jgi:ribonuclease R
MGKTKHGKKKLSADKLRSIILKYFLKNPKERLSAGQLGKKIKLSNNKDSIDHALGLLKKEDFIRSVSDHKYVLNKRKVLKEVKSLEGKTYFGTVDLIRSGAAYITVDDLDNDIYVPEKHLGTAMNGDRVEVAVTFNKGRKPEGKVIKVIKRKTSQVMGVLSLSKKYGIVKHKSKKAELEIFIRHEDLGGAKDGDKVLADINKWGSNENHGIWGKVSKILNDLDDHNWTMESILLENGFSSTYPEDVLKELEQIPEHITEEDIASRRDFRNVLTFTIDPDTAQDFDDAISFQELENGHIEIGVHIADVTHYLKPGTSLDKEAYTRSTSVYLVDRCIAMLPEKLSNNLCSLVPNKDRLTFSAIFQFDKKFNLKDAWFGKTIIHSDRRFTYDEGQESLDNENGLYHHELTVINNVAHKLREEKMKNGAIAFESDELKFVLDDNNKPVSVFVKERKDIHMLIEDFMLLANKKVAKYIATKNQGNTIPFVYRIHDVPDMDRLVDLKALLDAYDVKLDLSTPEKIGKSFNILSEKAKTDAKYKLLMDFAIRTMAKAIYSTENIGHYGLHFDYYTHFTSPIRRYSDVIVHRILDKNLKGDFRTDKALLESNCAHISSQERKAMEAERDSIKYKQVEFMKSHVGEEFDGFVSGMIEKGIFVVAGESRAEGLIPFSRLKGHFSVNENKIMATSIRHNKSLKLGDKVRVKILDTDLINRQIEMDLIDY